MTDHKIFYTFTANPFDEDIDFELVVRFTHFKEEPLVGASEEIRIDSISCGDSRFHESLLTFDDLKEIKEQCWDALTN